MSKTPIILIADDHVIIRRGMKFLLDNHFGKQTVYETETTDGLMKLLTEHPFTHLILDMQLADRNVMEVFPQIVRDYPATHILIYTMSPEDVFARRLLQLGALGFLSKQSPEEEVLVALNMFFMGKKYISPQLKDYINDDLKGLKSSNPIEQLSDREKLVLTYLIKGDGVKEIANRLDVKANTVATFKARLFDKLGVSNLIDLHSITELYGFKTS